MKTRRKSSSTTCKPMRSRSVKRISHKILRPYSEDDYNSNDGMLTTVWGPGMWHYLHTMSFNYPVNPTNADKQNYRNFMLQLKYVLPCGKCRKNLRRNYVKLPLIMKHMESRATFSKYVYDLHELVNQILHKKSGLSFETVRERYEHFRARCAIPQSEMPKIPTPENEKGCTEPLYGEKSKCILKIVPENTKCKTMEIDQKCIKKKIRVR
jgi:hypothetical protein